MGWLYNSTIELVTGVEVSFRCDPDVACSPAGGPSECMPDSDPYSSGDDD